MTRQERREALASACIPHCARRWQGRELTPAEIIKQAFNWANEMLAESERRERDAPALRLGKPPELGKP